MASPQAENGHTQIANEVLEKVISSGLNGTEICVMLLIIRKTWGWKKKEDAISLSQFCSIIPVSKASICKALKNLKLVNIIKLVKFGKSINDANIYSFNKDYDSWQLVKKSKLVNFSKRTSKLFDKKLVKNSLHTKETLTKESIQKKDIDPFTKSLEEKFNKIWPRYPNREGRKKALIHFRTSVKNDKDWMDIKTALENYIDSKKVKEGFIKNGETWFNNWQDWVEAPDSKNEFSRR